MSNKDLLIKILTKKAKGYISREKTDEYALAEQELKLIKRKITEKRIAPDVNALKALLEMSTNMQDVSQMTDEQLEVEKLRLLNLLKVCGDSPQHKEEEND